MVAHLSGSAALDAMIEEISESAAALNELMMAANRWALGRGLEPPYPGVDSGTTSRTVVQLRADQFADFNAPSAAARAFLELRGREVGAATIEEIFDALKRGGYGFDPKLDDAGAKGGLKIALAKDANVTKLPNGAFGLTSWYPNREREREREGAESFRPVRKAKTDSPPTVHLLPSTEEPPPLDDSDIPF